MICIYDPLDTTFDGHGVGVLHPLSCVVHEVAGGAYELEIVMPITVDDRWKLLCSGAVVRAPVPCVVTPRLQMLEQSGAEGVAVYRAVFGSNTLASARYLTIRAQADLYAAALCKVPEFTELIATGETDRSGEWLQVISPDGVCGWVPHWYVEYVREYVPAAVSGEEVASRQIRDQLFRIYAISHGEDGQSLSARARHISYDQVYNAVAEVVIDVPTAAAEACRRLMDAMENQDHGFRLLTDLERTVTGTWKCANGISALLDPAKGLASLLRARVVRDNFDIFLLENTPDETSFVIRHGRNLVGVGTDISDDAVYTRFVPLGLDADGKLMRLPEGYIDSVHVGEYAFPRIKMWQVSGAQVGGKVTLGDGSTKTLDAESVYEMMRDAARADMAAGEDELQCKVRVQYVDLGKTVEYGHLVGLQAVQLYDWVTVIHGPHQIKVHKQVTSYDYDCLQQRYTGIALGDVFADSTAGVI